MPAPPPKGMSSTWPPLSGENGRGVERAQLVPLLEGVGDVALAAEPLEPLREQRHDVQLHQGAPCSPRKARSTSIVRASVSTRRTASRTSGTSRSPRPAARPRAPRRRAARRAAARARPRARRRSRGSPRGPRPTTRPRPAPAPRRAPRAAPRRAAARPPHGRRSPTGAGSGARPCPRAGRPGCPCPPRAPRRRVPAGPGGVASRGSCRRGRAAVRRARR